MASLNPAQDLISPYHIHPTYNEWERSVIISLPAKNILGFIDGTISKPAIEDPLHQAFLDPTIARSVLYFETTRVVWKYLEERFGQTSGTQVYSLKQQNSDIGQGSDTISVFYTKLKMIWNELDAFYLMPICICTNCNCGVTRKMLKMNKKKHLDLFLMKLNPDYKIIKENLLLHHPLPTLSHAYSNYITIPDETKVMVKHRVYLISIPKLCKDMSCLAYFPSEKCYLRGPSLTRCLQLGSLKKGLYCLDTSLCKTSG
ncbi:Lanosterol 14-alpha demethylase [Bienertia sinuspersici]